MKEKFERNGDYKPLEEIGSYEGLTEEEKIARIETSILLYKDAPIDPELKERILENLNKQLEEARAHKL